jgi:release factor glutamine methyltransferase
VTIQDAELEAVRRLQTGEDVQIRNSAHSDALAILKEVLQADRTWLITHSGDEIDDEALQIFGQLITRRLRGVPVAYLTHKVGFYRREYYVDERVLVPRQETEHLVELALTELRPRAAQAERLTVLDVGTGSGAIAIALAAEMPELDLTATDISTDALAVAEQNARDTGVAGRIRFVHGDLVSAVGGSTFDCITANLPYVKSRDLPVPPNPVGFEPRVALDGGEDGLFVYRRFVRALPPHLRSRALVVLEAAPDTVEILAEMCKAELDVEWCKTGKDYANLGRFVVARIRAGAEPVPAPSAAQGHSPGIAAPAFEASAVPEAEDVIEAAYEVVEVEMPWSGEHAGHDAEGDWTSVEENGWGFRAASE